MSGSRLIIRILILLILPLTLYAKEAPLLVRADKVSFQEDEDILIAEGHVEVSQFLDPSAKKHTFFKKKYKSTNKEDETERLKKLHPERYLQSDKLTYNRKTKILTATGHIIFVDENNNVIHAEKLEFNDRFENGFITELKLLMSDDEGRFTANSFKSDDGNISVLDRVIYSPCHACNAESIPFWQLRAREVIHNKDEQKLKYKDVTMDIYGVPTLYAPYFFHPDPSVKRKSGFLFPTVGNSSDLGTSIRTPYYYVIDDHSDILVTPTITSKQGIILHSQYRKRFARGDLKLDGSITHSRNLDRRALRTSQSAPVPPQVRYNFSSAGRFELSDYDLVTFNINRASDTTYLRRYNIDSGSPLFAQDKNLTSEAKYERFKGNTYGSLKGYAFQTDRSSTTPLIFPLARLCHQTEPGRFGETYNFDANFQSLHRNQQISMLVPKTSHRGIVQGKMYLPYIMRTGQMLEWETSLRGDVYYIEKFTPAGARTAGNHSEGRIFPQTALTMRYPLLSRNRFASWMLEPILQLNLAQGGLNPTKIPNEDSRLSEVDDVNLFFLSRMNGFDRTDSGQRIVYGLNNSFYGPKKIKVSWFIGQSRRFNRHPIDLIGDRKNTSDYVTRFQLYPSEWMRIHYRGRFSPKGVNRFSEITANLGKPILSLNTTYVFVNKFDTPGQQDIKQINTQLHSKIHENWQIAATQNRNLSKSQKSALAHMVSIVYENDCFQSSFGVFETKYQDRDIKPTTGFLLQFTFKNLGTIHPIASASFPTIMTRRLDG